MSRAALDIKNLRKVYNNDFEALKGIDLRVEQGDFFALLGPNGAGKSTTISIVCSLVTKTAGEVNVFGFDLDRDPKEVRRQIGLVPQEFNFNLFEPAFEVVVNQAGYYGLSRKVAAERAEKTLKQLELWDKRHQESRALSGGMKRRLMIARALVHEPKLLILDEPTAGVDIEIRHSMWAFLQEINKAGTTIILTTHYLEEAENLCRHIAIIDSGRIAENDRMDRLLRRLHQQTLLLELAEPLDLPPQLADFICRFSEDGLLEVDLKNDQDFNQLFAALSAQNVRVLNVRSKQNRLEQIFLERTTQNHSGAVA